MRSPRSEYASWSSEQVGNFFLGRGLSAGDLDLVSRGYAQDRIYIATQLFARIGWNNFTNTDIGMLVYNKEWGEKTERQRHSLSNYISDIISDMFPLESRVYEGFQMPAIHLLRIATGNYNGNLHKTKGYEIVDGKMEKVEKAPYPEVRISADDWREGITLPLPLETDSRGGRYFGQETMELLGYIWGLGFLWESKYKTSNEKALCLTFTYKHEDVLEDVGRLFKSNFNFDPTVQNDKDKPYRKITKIGGKEFISRGHYFNKSSQAVVSWLEDELGFPSPRQGYATMPRVLWDDESINAFLKGATRSIMYTKIMHPTITITERKGGKAYKYPRVILSKKDETFMHGIDALLHFGGFPHSAPTLDKGVPTISVHKEGSKKLLEMIAESESS